MLIQEPQQQAGAAAKVQEALADIPAAVEQWLAAAGLGDFAPAASRLGLALAVVLAAVAAHLLVRLVAVRMLRALVRRTETKLDDALVEHKVFLRLAHLVPALVLYFGAPLIFPEEDGWRGGLQRLSLAYMVLIGAMAVSALLSAAVSIYEQAFKNPKGFQIRTYLQVVKIFVWVFGAVLVIATLLDKTPWALLGGLGAMTAVLLLVFKDAILGFVASIQITANNMVEVGDWIEMPQYGADGDVIEISLTTVKVQNWDKTITTLPTYALASQAFKNWRGMSESGGRRIKRAILIDQSSVRFLDEEMLGRLKKIQHIQSYLDEKAEEISKWNQEQGVDEATLVNGRHLTNLGTFRAYVERYLKAHPAVHPDMTFLVRQLAPTEKGLPLEVYVFLKEQRWAEYESIQADIFDHLLAAAPEFGLRVVQMPTGADLRALTGRVDAG